MKKLSRQRQWQRSHPDWVQAYSRMYGHSFQFDFLHTLEEKEKVLLWVIRKGMKIADPEYLKTLILPQRRPKHYGKSHWRGEKLLS